jgi:tetratricopeptide (TPR) repeat protein
MISEDSSRERAEQLLTEARRAGDRAAEASALTDLGVLALDAGDNLRAVACLEEALALAKVLGNQAQESDVLPNLGLALLRTGQHERASHCMEQALMLARAAGDQYAEKFALERMGTVQAVRGDLPGAIRSLAGALTLARTLDDRQHGADLLWHIAIRLAECGQREQALAHGQAAIRLLESLGKPEARVYDEHLEKYQWGDGDSPLGATTAEVRAGKSFAVAAPPSDRVGPGYLRMAVSAAKALTRFVGSGLKTVSAERFQERVQQCDGCGYHTGLRCRVCGCFTNLKARLPYEQCPVGKWRDI